MLSVAMQDSTGIKEGKNHRRSKYKYVTIGNSI